MHFIGVDHHKQSSTLTVLDQDGREVRTAKLRNTRLDVETFLRQAAPDGFQAVVESGWGSYVMADLLRDLGGEIKMANPYEVKAIAHAQIKTDRRDSRILARLLRMDMIPEVYQRAMDNREAQRVMRLRAFWTARQTEVKNKVRALLAQQPEEIRLEAESFQHSLFGPKGLQYLGTIRLRERDQAILDELLAYYRELEVHRKGSDGMVARLYETLPAAKLIDTIPGFGPTLSVLAAIEIADVRRFPEVQNLLSYAGVIPSTHASGERSFQGHLKHGNKWLRWALIEAVYPATTADVGLRCFYQRLANRKGANVAKAATARRLLMIIYRMLKQNRPYIPHEAKISAA